LKHELNENLENSLGHEIENVNKAFRIQQDSILILNPNEFLEADLTRITDHPFFVQIYNTKGKLLLKSKNTEFISPIPKRFHELNEELYFEDDYAGKEEIRAAYKKLTDKTGTLIGYLQLSTTKSRLTVITTNLLIFNLIAFPVILLVILIASILISKRTFSPINKIISIAKNISTSNLNERVSYEADSKDELGNLRDTLNDLFERLEFQVKQISSFTDNASHQLTNPLTAINSELDFLLNNRHGIDAQKNSVIVIKEETQRMIKIVKTLLLLAKDSKTLYDQKTVFNFSKFVKDNINRIYKEKKIEIDIEEDLYLRGNSDYFLMALQNLIDNAFKYSNEDWVTIHAKQMDDKVILRIEDFGIGIAEEEKEKVFEKFYRSEKVEMIGIKGYGLGLSIVKLIITAMNGTIEIKDNKPRGTVFIITFPSVALI
jgi:signal transduction histidine kinase